MSARACIASDACAAPTPDAVLANVVAQMVDVLRPKVEEQTSGLTDWITNESMAQLEQFLDLDDDDAARIKQQAEQQVQQQQQQQQQQQDGGLSPELASFDADNDEAAAAAAGGGGDANAVRVAQARAAGRAGSVMSVSDRLPQLGDELRERLHPIATSVKEKV